MSGYAFVHVGSVSEGETEDIVMEETYFPPGAICPEERLAHVA